ncbi:hypothetical protein SAY86_013490 [Trapa natans]|uniref:YTH domain-containing family protein n=1 Tax=Trapa natans TaxID=22666 RepID=A0AAN7KXF2_TRANT|nr:hypothetical protein SAY86_013490 [Trapa natans]
MDSPAPPADQAANLLQNLSLDSQPKPLEIPEPKKKPSGNQSGSVDSGNAPDGNIPPYERALSPFLHDFTDPTICYVPNGYPYYYGGYDGTGNEWDDFSRYGNSEGVDIATGLYGDNGSIMYPSYSFAPYSPYSPATTPVPGNEQLYGTQQYHYPPPYFQSFPNNVPNASSFSPAPQTEVSNSDPAEQKLMPIETLNSNLNGAKGGDLKGNSRSSTLKSSHQNSGYGTNSLFGLASLPGSITSGYQDARFGYDGLASPIPWSDVPPFLDGPRLGNTGMTNSISNAKNMLSSRNQSYSNSQFMGLHHPTPISAIAPGNGFMNRSFPNKLYGQYGSTFTSGMGFSYDARTSGRGWQGMDNKYKHRGHAGGYYGYSNENMDGLNELNRGPRSKGSKNQKTFSSVTLAVKGQNPSSNGVHEIENNNTCVTPDCEQYNKMDFPEYADAKFFIIKSYSEDDVHKSIKYNVWASTPNGNKKLDAAYRESLEKPDACPIFLFFSVNTSGQFVGVAEMMGVVDFRKNLEYWQQDKWNGCFPVKWHIVKDAPNNLFKHIILENNENKPVTNSRDTQEVKLEQGLKMIKIFKDHSSKTCLLDDFEFYENRQKVIQEKKAKQQQFQKQIWEGKLIAQKKESFDVELKSQKLSGDHSDAVEPAIAMCDVVAQSSEDTTKEAVQEIPEIIENGAANAY